jgi:hypothetical protein
MGATVADLMAVRSTLACQLECYYSTLIDWVDKTPWYKDGVGIRASSLAIPARVIKSTKDDRHQSNSRGQWGWDDDPHTSQDSGLARVYEEPESRTHRATVLWQEELLNVTRGVVLGAPGGGKTFLTATTAIRLAKDGTSKLSARSLALDELPLPLWLELKRLPGGEAAATDPVSILKSQLSSQFGVSLPAAYILDRLVSPNCWLIMDGLDELSDDQRRLVGRLLESTDTAGWTCRMLLTCRTANYDRFWIPWREIAEYELSPLNVEEMRLLIEGWFQQDEPRGRTLRALLSRNFALRHACRSPLLTALACQAHEAQPLTEDTGRRDVYSRSLAGILSCRWRSEGLAEGFHTDDLRDLLPAVAWRLFVDQPGNLFLNVRVTNAIAKANQTGLMKGDAFQIRDQLVGCGLLIAAGNDARGRGQVSFLHRTFHEFLVSEHVLNIVEEHDWECAAVEWLGERIAISLAVRKLSWIPAWREVMILLAAGLDQVDDLGEFMKCLLEYEVDDEFHHRLALAALCLAEVRRDVRRQPGIRGIADLVTRRVFDLRWSDVQGAVHRLPHLRDAWVAAGLINGNVGETPLIDLLLQRAAPRQNPEMEELMKDLADHADPEFPGLTTMLARAMLGAAEVMGHVDAFLADPLNTETHQFLDSGTRFKMALGAIGDLGVVALRHHDVFPTLMAGLQSTQLLDAGVADELLFRFLQEEVLSVQQVHELVGAWLKFRGGGLPFGMAGMGMLGIGPGHRAKAQMIPALLMSLRDHHQPLETGIFAGMALGSLASVATHPSELVSELVELARSGVERTQMWAAAALWSSPGWMLAANSEALPLFLTLLEQGKMSHLAAATLGHMGEEAGRHPEVVPALLVVLESLYLENRVAAAEALGCLGAISEHRGTTVARLMGTLHHPIPEVRAASTRALENLAEARACSRELIPTLLQDMAHAEFFSNACQILAKMGAEAAGYPGVLSALLRALHHRDFDIQSAARTALEELGKYAGHPEVVSALVADLAKPKYADAACGILRKMGEAAASHVETEPLLQLLRSDKFDLRFAAGRMLEHIAGLGRLDEETIQALAAGLHEPAIARASSRILCALGEQAARLPDVIPALINIVGGDGENREDASAALVTFAGAIDSRPELVDLLVAILHYGDRWSREYAMRVLERLPGLSAKSHVVEAMLQTLWADHEIRGRHLETLASLLGVGWRFFSDRDGGSTRCTKVENLARIGGRK